MDDSHKPYLFHRHVTELKDFGDQWRLSGNFVTTMMMMFLFIYIFLSSASLGDVTAQVSLQPALKFNGGGHINHTIFWTNLSPNGGGEPKG